ncbi:MAG: TRAP transporter substrate-binding protein DctP [Polyangiaceae bacterium]
MKLQKALIALFGAFALMVGVLPREASAQEVLKFGTLAPKQSIWGQVFQVWEAAVEKKSDGKIDMQWDYNGVQGDEGAMVGKMKAGQLDGAAVTAVGLSKYYKPVVAMQMPGALTNWDKVDAALAAVGDDFNKGLKDAGAQNIGWGFVGMAHLFLKGTGTVSSPDDLKGRKPYVWKDDTVTPVFYQIIGGVSTQPLNVPEVLSNLKTGAVDTVVSPSLAVEQLQWAGQLDQASNQITNAAIGAIIMNNKRLESLPGDLRTIVVDTGKVAAKALTAKIKTEDGESFKRMKLTKFDVNEEKFNAVFAKVRARLKESFDKDLVSKIEAAGGVKN